MGVIFVWTSLPDSKSAQKLAASLVEKKLAACVSVFAGVSSVYRWKGKLEKARESVLLIKTSKAKWPALQKFVLSRHPYELPELVALPASLVFKKYLKWIETSVQ